MVNVVRLLCHWGLFVYFGLCGHCVIRSLSLGCLSNCGLGTYSDNDKLKDFAWLQTALLQAKVEAPVAVFDNLERVDLWSDGASQYKNGEWVTYILSDKAKKDFGFTSIVVNFFETGEGKDRCDEIFGVISGYNQRFYASKNILPDASLKPFVDYLNVAKTSGSLKAQLFVYDLQAYNQGAYRQQYQADTTDVNTIEKIKYYRQLENVGTSVTQ